MQTRKSTGVLILVIVAIASCIGAAGKSTSDAKVRLYSNSDHGENLSHEASFPLPPHLRAEKDLQERHRIL